MLRRDCRPYKIRFRSSRCNCDNRNTCTYTSMLDATRRNGIAVAAAQTPADALGVCREQDSMFCENGLVRYKNRWEHRDAEVFVGDCVLTGVAVYAAPDTLHIVSGECSRFVPLEQVVGICVG